MKLTHASEDYDYAVDIMKAQRRIARSKLRKAACDLVFDELLNAASEFKAGVDLATGLTVEALEVAKVAVDAGTQMGYQSVPKIIGAGLTVNTDPSAVAGALTGVAKTTGVVGAQSGIYGAKTIAASTGFWAETLRLAMKAVTDGFDYYDAEVESWERLESAVCKAYEAACTLQNAFADLAAAEQAYRAQIAEGDLVLEELAMTRRHWANEATRVRYADMYDRIQRNNALTKYQTSFDTAQRHVYLLAKVYDYETGLLSSDPRAGDAFMRDRARRGREGCDDGAQRDPVGRRHAHVRELGRPQGTPRREQPREDDEVVLAPILALPHPAGRGGRCGLARGARRLLA